MSEARMVTLGSGKDYQGIDKFIICSSGSEMDEIIRLSFEGWTNINFIFYNCKVII